MKKILDEDAKRQIRKEFSSKAFYLVHVIPAVIILVVLIAFVFTH